MNTLNRSLKQGAYEEAKKFLIIAFYLWLIFALMLLYKPVILGEPIGPLAHRFAIINALALGKVIHIGRAFHLGGLTTDQPLILPTLKKSGLFSVLLAFSKSSKTPQLVSFTVALSNKVLLRSVAAR